MGNNEEEKSTKTEKPSSPATMDQANQTNQPNIHVYPDWAAMQAYYGQRVTMPPYYNSAVASGHAPHPYMWGPPQVPMMPPYGPPYAAIYSHGGVYPAVPIGPHTHSQGVPSSPAAVTPLSIETPPKSSGNNDQGLMKKLKEFDGLAMSIGNGHAESAERGGENRLSPSVDTEGSSDGSDDNTSGANQTRRKRSRGGTPTTGMTLFFTKYHILMNNRVDLGSRLFFCCHHSTHDGEGKTEIQSSPISKDTAASNKIVAVAPASVAGTIVGPVVSSGMTTVLELRNPSSVHSKANTTSAPQPSVLPAETWLQNERELKRERRKQSNRESARRSRLRKQAETEELARKVDSLNSENGTLKSEINRLTESSEKMRVENATLREKLKIARLGQTQEITLNIIDSERATPVSTENLLSRVNNNSSSNDRTMEDENDFCENKPNSGAKLHQLLDTSPRADAVAAG
ncbi:common plant regulatory factor 1 isoform X3 [Vigna angularis]|uniref:common plant regulatory factor 1 isoform X3 n=1 Tax=Phaseolus angularis TaxID=3914 RepID=UPI0022B44C2C|nr:common plant regulatory factor 1 isoform X3 [Vigna angularis]